MQADFVAFMRAELTLKDAYDRWWPETLAYAVHQYGPFEIFARATSKQYLARVLALLGISNLTAIRDKLAEYAADKRSVPRFDHRSIEPLVLLGLEQLGTGV